MVKDSFNLKKNDNIVGRINKTVEESDTSVKGICYDLNNKTGNCTYVIIPGIDIGWIWRDLNIYSTSIMNIINKKPNSEKNKTTESEQIKELERLQKMQQKIQNLVLQSVFIFLFLVVAYITLTKYDDDNKQFFGITNISYFIKDLVKNGSFSFSTNTEKRYNFTYITLIFVCAIFLFVIPANIKHASKKNTSVDTNDLFGVIFIKYFFIIIVFGWIILGNVLFTKRSVVLISILLVSTILIGVIHKSNEHFLKEYKKKYGADVDEKMLNENKWVVYAIVVIIICINLVMITYICIKNIKFIKNTSESVQTISDDTNTYIDLTDYFNKKIFNNVQQDQETLLKTLRSLQKDYTTLIEGTPNLEEDTDINTIYARYFEKILSALKSKDEWFKKTCTLYNLRTNTKLKDVSMDGLLSDHEDEAGIIGTICKKIFKEDDVAEFIKKFGTFKSEEPSTIALDWEFNAILRDLCLGAIVRCVEIFNLTVRNSIDIIINSFKCMFHFIVHGIEDEDKIKTLNDMNLFNYWDSTLLKIGKECDFDQAHKRIASMYELFIQFNIKE